MASLKGLRAWLHDLHTNDAARRLGSVKEQAILARMSKGREANWLSDSVDCRDEEEGEQRLWRLKLAVSDGGVLTEVVFGN